MSASCISASRNPPSSIAFSAAASTSAPTGTQFICRRSGETTGRQRRPSSQQAIGRLLRGRAGTTQASVGHDAGRRGKCHRRALAAWATGIENVAEKLHVSPRTLRRKLAAEDVTFARILEDLRFALAKHYLAEQDFSISRIAWLLGYAEVSAFSHAFRRWSGRPPRAARSRRRTAPLARAKRRARR